VQQPPQSLIHFFGLIAWGDFGPLTMYRSARRRVVAYQKAPPDKPPTAWQIAQRERFKDAALTWKTFTPYLKPNWERAAKRLSLKVTGYNLWVYYKLKNAEAYIRTLERQSKLRLLPPTPTPSSSSSSSSG